MKWWRSFSIRKVSRGHESLKHQMITNKTNKKQFHCRRYVSHISLPFDARIVHSRTDANNNCLPRSPPKSKATALPLHNHHATRLKRAKAPASKAKCVSTPKLLLNTGSEDEDVRHFIFSPACACADFCSSTWLKSEMVREDS